MSTLEFPTQDNARALCQESLIPGEAGSVEAGEKTMQGTEVLTEDMVSISTDCLVYKLAEFINRIFIRLFRVTVHDADPLEDSDSDYPGCWACCA